MAVTDPVKARKPKTLLFSSGKCRRIRQSDEPSESGPPKSTSIARKTMNSKLTRETNSGEKNA